jgi:hypothetical protein
MRTFTILSLACCFLSVVSALPILGSSSATDDSLYRRMTYPPVSQPKVTFQHTEHPHSAGRVLDHMNLTPANRKIIEDHHIDTVKTHMQHIPGAKSAEIVNLAHSRGSVDPNVHITAVFKDHAGNKILVPHHGDPTKASHNVHVYTNPHNIKDGASVLPPAYHDAVRAHQIAKHGKFDKI